MSRLPKKIRNLRRAGRAGIPNLVPPKAAAPVVEEVVEDVIEDVVDHAEPVTPATDAADDSTDTSEEEVSTEEETAADEDESAEDDSVEDDSTEEEAGDDIPDYDSMGYAELRKLVSSEEEASLPDRKQATFVAFLKSKHEAE